MTVVGLTASALSTSNEEGVTVRVAVLLTPLYEAVMVTFRRLVTVVEEMLNVALVLPASIVTLAGVEVTGELSLSETTAPPAGAGPLRDTVP